MWNPFRLPSRRAQQYVRPDRLADVLALIQLLALDPLTQRSEGALLKELQGPPRSAESWRVVAKDHPEFFRVDEKSEHPVPMPSDRMRPCTGYAPFCFTCWRVSFQPTPPPSASSTSPPPPASATIASQSPARCSKASPPAPPARSKCFLRKISRCSRPIIFAISTSCFSSPAENCR